MQKIVLQTYGIFNMSIANNVRTDNVNEKVDNTVLYIPIESLKQSPEEASKDIGLVQRMESKSKNVNVCVCWCFSTHLFSLFLAAMIHWTDQIKDLLMAHEGLKMLDNCGPLQEIAFWESRTAKLLDISQQLQKPDVRQVKNILQLSNSYYQGRFCKLAEEIKVQGVRRANTVLLFYITDFT